MKRAQKKGVIKIVSHQIRDFTTDKHRTTDDTPYGGGAGMVLKAEPILRATERILKLHRTSPARRKVIILSAKGKQFTQARAQILSSRHDHIILISGRYEGIDERVKKILRAEEISIGPYITTDGDVAAMVLVSAITRLVPGAIRLESLAEESHWDQFLKSEIRHSKSAIRNPQSVNQLEYPHYTRPEVIKWKGKKYRVPKILLSGNHALIKSWRAKKSQG